MRRVDAQETPDARTNSTASALAGFAFGLALALGCSSRSVNSDSPGASEDARGAEETANVRAGSTRDEPALAAAPIAVDVCRVDGRLVASERQSEPGQTCRFGAGLQIDASLTTIVQDSCSAQGVLVAPPSEIATCQVEKGGRHQLFEVPLESAAREELMRQWREAQDAAAGGK